MTTFNHKTTGKITTNISGHAAYRLAPRDHLMSCVLTSFVNEPKYYGDNTDELLRLAADLASTDGLFVAKLAVYVRTVMNMRSSSHALLAVLAHEVKGAEYVRAAVRSAVVRGDDVTAMLAAYFSLYPGEALPNSLRRGLRDALDGLDAYQLGKYRMEGRMVTMADAVKLCHPHRREATRALLAGELGKPMSWETELSAHGNNVETWERLLAEGKVPYMALLRNVRNLVLNPPANLDAALERLADPQAVAASRALPFRFWSAYQAVEHCASSKVLAALGSALDASADNASRLPGRTLVAVDTSGSMSCRLSRKGSTTYADMAALMGAILARVSEDCVLYTFDSKANRVPVAAGASVLETMGRLRGNGGCTNMRAVFERAAMDRVDCDRMVFLSDNEVNASYGSYLPYADRTGKKCLQAHLARYRQLVGHRVWLHAVDLAGYGTTQFDGPDTSFTAGWSEKVLDFMSMAEAGTGSLGAAVEAVGLR